MLTKEDSVEQCFSTPGGREASLKGLQLLKNLLMEKQFIKGLVGRVNTNQQIRDMNVTNIT